jgi:hypothetical protein
LFPQAEKWGCYSCQTGSETEHFERHQSESFVSSEINDKLKLNLLQEETSTKAEEWMQVNLSLSLINKDLHHKDIWGSGCIDPHFLDLGTSWR